MSALRRALILLVLAAGLAEAAEAASHAIVQARRAVVKVEVQQRSARTPLVGEVFYREGNRSIGFEEPHESVGTATFVDGKIVTNYHVVESGISIVLIDHEGIRHEASVVSGDPVSDIALLSLDDESARASFKNSLPLARRDAGIGEAVVAVGYGAGEALAITEGIVSARYGEGRGVGAHLDRLWTDALITDGFSGGPLLNSSGECVGILHAYGRPEGGLRDMGFVIPASVLKESFAPTSPWKNIGITVSGTPDRVGVVVEYVRADSAASQAGIEQRDRLLSVNGELLDSIGRLRELLHGNRARRLEIKGFRQGEERLWSLLPTDLADPRHNSDFKRWRGLELEISEQPGIYIVSVKPGSVSERAGVSVDDRIMGLNGEENADASALWALLSGLGAEPQLLGIRRGDQELWLPTAPE